MNNNSNYQVIEEQVAELYDETYSKNYYTLDQEQLLSTFHQYLVRSIKEAIASMGSIRPQVLDIGCGTGRFFYAASGAGKLVGVDVSRSMLKLAEHPIKERELASVERELVCGNIFNERFLSTSFDLAYAIGVFGEHSPFDQKLLERVHTLLRPGGKAIITVVDKKTKWQRWLIEVFYPLLPGWLQAKVHFQRYSFYLTKKQLQKVIDQSLFKSSRLDYFVSDSKKWHGAHFICFLEKE